MLHAERDNDARSALWGAFYESRMNVAYYQGLVAILDGFDGWIRFLTSVASSSAVVALFKAGPGALAQTIAVVAAVLAVASSTFKFAERAKLATAMLGRYIGHAQTFERLYRDHAWDDPRFREELDALDATEREEAAKIGPAQRWLLRRAQGTVDRQIGTKPATA